MVEPSLSLSSPTPPFIFTVDTHRLPTDGRQKPFSQKEKGNKFKRAALLTRQSSVDNDNPSHAQGSATMVKERDVLVSPVRGSQEALELGYSLEQILTMTKEGVLGSVALYGKEALGLGYSLEHILTKAKEGILVGDTRNRQRALDLGYSLERILTMTKEGVLGSTVQNVKKTPWALDILSHRFSAWLRRILRLPCHQKTL